LKEEIEEMFPGYGNNPVQTEEYSQWVIEDNFASTFPDLSLVGATLTSNLEPYEETKIRILNGGHTSLAYLGALAGTPHLIKLWRIQCTENILENFKQKRLFHP